MKDALKLIEKFRNRKTSQKEEEVLDRWVHELEGNEPQEFDQQKYDQIMARGEQSILPLIHEPRRARLWPRIAIAASVTVAVLSGVYLYEQNNSKKDGQIAQSDIDPGKTAATLTLSNGKKIYIADAVQGKVAEEAGVKISKNASGELIYTIVANDSEPPKMQTLTTYRGETQIVVLPDGSKVWLNAASSLKYPSTFVATPDRKVELTGEAYFEVAKDKTHPFIVETNKQKVEVLGTHFNINSYNDEPQIKTTLLEGSVRVSATGGPAKILKPGEQSELSSTNVLKVSDVDVDDVVAWKEGFFAFEDEAVQDVMKQLARWYNVEVEYSSEDLKYKKFSGSISRYDKVSQVLDKLGKIKLVSFRLENRKIIVENKTK